MVIIYAGAGAATQKVFHNGYHPNADKWTTSRTLSLSGDASGSVSWDGSSNATLSVTVNDDSHNHTWNNIDGGSVNGWSSLRVSTTHGYIDFGPANTSHAHIYTDRPDFYFNKELKVNNNLVWNAGNDGSGSGLDADTLDGQHGSYYSSISGVAYGPWFESGSTSNSMNSYVATVADDNTWMFVSVNVGTYTTGAGTSDNPTVTRYRFRKAYRSFS